MPVCLYVCMSVCLYVTVCMYVLVRRKNCMYDTRVRTCVPAAGPFCSKLLAQRGPRVAYYMHVCMYVRMYACMYVYVCMYACMHVVVSRLR